MARSNKKPKPVIIATPIAEAVEDMSLYPRHAVDDAHVAALAHALESGAQLPPPVVCAKSKRIADGWHRIRAHRRVFGPEAVIDMEHVTYDSEDALLFDAVARNSAHGRKLDRIDQTRCAVMMQRRNFSAIQIAAALHVPEQRVEKLVVKIARARANSAGAVPGTNTVVLKRPVVHLADKLLTERQSRAMSSMPGTSFLLIARQLTLALSVELVDLTDERLVEQLRTLRDELDRVLAAT